MSTNLVQEISSAGSVPANRPIDHLRRIGTGLFAGSCAGTVIAVLSFGPNLHGPRFWLILLLLLVMAALFLSPWLLQPKSPAHPIPVVARTLGTDEDVLTRVVRRGRNSGLLVPVVVRPVVGGAVFRSVIMLRDIDVKNPVEPPAGTLMALQQNEAGLGELSNIDTVTKEQEELLARLRKHPRELPNKGVILPMRRGPLDATPAWAGVQMVMSGVVGFALSAVVVMTIG
ncbi:hypothetical protein [Actinobaculum sp. 313]|uniref:hypothetical protein n=1 Tax=Actinobaculum sp. 313 TaxID=2495645 RepID=UPI000F7410DD|nr:hypothetical protein [Actinobaculum sp. 313]